MATITKLPVIICVFFCVVICPSMLVYAQVGNTSWSDIKKLGVFSQNNPAFIIEAYKATSCDKGTAQWAEIIIKNNSEKRYALDYDLVVTTSCGNKVTQHFFEYLDGNDQKFGARGVVFVEAKSCEGIKVQASQSKMLTGTMFDQYDRIKSVGYANLTYKEMASGTQALATDHTDSTISGTTNTVVKTTPGYPAQPATPVASTDQPAANSYGNAIQQAANLNTARINAMASGNKSQAAKIQQVQNQQMLQNINTLGNQLIALINQPVAQETSGEYNAAQVTENNRFIEVRRELKTHLAEWKETGTDYSRAITAINKILSDLFLLNNYQMYIAELDGIVNVDGFDHVLNHYKGSEQKALENYLFYYLYGGHYLVDDYNNLRDEAWSQLPDDFMKLYIKACKNMGPLGSIRDIYPVEHIKLHQNYRPDLDDLYNAQPHYTPAEYSSIIDALTQCSELKIDTLRKQYLHIDYKKISKKDFIIPEGDAVYVNSGNQGAKMALVNLLLVDITYLQPDQPGIDINRMKSYLDKSRDEIMRVKRLVESNSRSFAHKEFDTWGGIYSDHYVNNKFYANNFIFLLYTRYGKLYEYAITHATNVNEKKDYYNEATAVLNTALATPLSFKVK